MAIPIGLVLGVALAASLIPPSAWLAAGILTAVILLIAHTFLYTSYTIDGDVLKIRCGLLFRSRISIAGIRQVSETRSPLSSPATSLDRLEIVYNTYNQVLISPKDKEAFISHLKEINPKIVVKQKT